SSRFRSREYDGCLAVPERHVGQVVATHREVRCESDTRRGRSVQVQNLVLATHGPAERSGAFPSHEPPGRGPARSSLELDAPYRMRELVACFPVVRARTLENLDVGGSSSPAFGSSSAAEPRTG